MPQVGEPTVARTSVRKLQEDSARTTESMDSIALAITALLGIASYVVQAKISRDAEKNGTEVEQRRTDAVRAENKVDALLARVQAQQEQYVQPLKNAQVDRTHSRRPQPKQILTVGLWDYVLNRD